MVGTGRAAQRGIIVRSQETLEKVRDIDTVVFDKTGTITTGEMSVVDVVPVSGFSSAQVVQWAAAVERGSEHPLGAAIVRSAGSDTVVTAEGITAVPGEGVVGDVSGARVFVGKPRDKVGAEALRLSTAELSLAATQVAVYRDDEFIGKIVIADTVKSTSAAAIAALHEQGCQTVLVTGDNAQAAQHIADEVGIPAEDVISGVLPTQKADKIAELQQQGKMVAMVGDGINDAAALALSHLGIAMGTGTDAAMQAADLTLVRGDLEAVPEALHLARRMNRIVRGNLFWAFIYNVAMIPLAMFGYLNPMMAGFAMVCSDLFVVGNSLRLRRG